MVTSVPGPRGPDRRAGADRARRLFTGGSGESRLAEAAEASGAVEAAAAVSAGLAGAVIHVDRAEPTREPDRAEAGEPVHSIHTGGAAGTRPHQAVVDVGLTAGPRESSEAAAHQLCRKPVSVVTQATIFTWGPGTRTRWELKSRPRTLNDSSELP